jgi:hypothetical protein
MIPLDTIIQGDCLEEMKKLPDKSIDAIVTDPPYFLLNDSGQGFMGKEWESLNRKKSIDIICKSKEFAHFVERIFTLLKVESNLEEASSVLETANTKDNDKSILSRPIVPYVEKKSKDSPRTSKANTNSVQGIALTRGALLDLLKGLSRSPITAIESQPENALFAVPSLFIESLIKKHAPRSASTSNLKQAVDAKEQEIPLTSTEDQRIKNVIAVMSGKICESKSMQETSLAACSVGSTAGTMRYKLITSEDIKNPSTTEWIIWSLYAIDAMQRSSSTGRIFTDFLNSDLVYQFHKQWAEEAIRVLKPGGHLLSFGGTRSYHTMAMAIEDAGFECRDMLEWCYGSGFPKSLNISKQLSQEDAKKWEGFGSAIKPAHEPVVLARKLLDGCTIAENVLRWGCGGLNIDATRIPGKWSTWRKEDGSINKGTNGNIYGDYDPTGRTCQEHVLGRFPSNLIYSYPEDLYTLKDNVTPNQLRELAEWLDENAKL